MENLKMQTLRESREYLDRLILGIEEVSKVIQEGNEILGIKKIIPIFDGIEYISNAITLTKGIQKDKIELDDLNEQLNEILEAFENEDYILIGDLLSYELLPVMESIKEKVDLSIE